MIVVSDTVKRRLAHAEELPSQSETRLYEIFLAYDREIFSSWVEIQTSLGFPSSLPDVPRTLRYLSIAKRPLAVLANGRELVKSVGPTPVLHIQVPKGITFPLLSFASVAVSSLTMPWASRGNFSEPSIVGNQLIGTISYFPYNPNSQAIFWNQVTPKQISPAWCQISKL